MQIDNSDKKLFLDKKEEDERERDRQSRRGDSQGETEFSVLSGTVAKMMPVRNPEDRSPTSALERWSSLKR